MGDYDIEKVRATQLKALEILKYFKKICDAHNIRFYVGSGCCIGAVRHKGVIPWDDDIDVFLLREDYEKLPYIWNKYADIKRYSYCRTNKKNNYHDTGASIRDNNTTFINKHCVNDDINQGLQIDLIPLDRRADSFWGHIRQVFFAMIYSLFNAQRLPDNQGTITRWLSQLAYLLIPKKETKDKIWQWAERKMIISSNENWTYYTELVTGIKGLTLKYPKKFYQKPQYVDFEDIKIPVSTCYKEYLNMVFGDYMKLPPEKDRMPKHNTVFVDLDNPYIKYKGIYYLRK